MLRKREYVKTHGGDQNKTSLRNAYLFSNAVAVLNAVVLNACGMWYHGKQLGLDSARTMFGAQDAQISVLSHWASEFLHLVHIYC